MSNSSSNASENPVYALFHTDEFTLEHFVGGTPLVRLKRLNKSPVTVLAKLEGNNPAGSVKDRPAYNMIMQAEKRGEIKPGDTLIEATSGNTGIALAMVAAMRGYKMKLIMPDNMSQERKDAMIAYGAELIEVTKAQGMEGARDLALQMQAEGKGMVLNQFGNPDNATITPQGLKFGMPHKAKSPILSAQWVQLARSWVCRNISKSKILPFKPLVYNHQKAQVLQGFVVGLRSICRRFLMQVVSIK